MPPKRKRAEDDSESVNGTATASSKIKATKAKAAPAAKKQPTRKTKAKNDDAEAMSGSEAEVVETKPKTRAAKKAKPDTDEPPQKKPRAGKSRSKETPSDIVDAPAPKAPPTKAISASKDPLDPKSYSDDRVVALFDQYADTDDVNVILGEGLEKLCSDGDIPMEGARPLLLAWYLNCKTMGTITRQEWTQGLQALKIDTVEKLAVALADLDEIVLSTSKTAPKQPKNPPYAKDRLLAQYPDPKASFSKLYHFLFNLCRVEQQRNIDVETACALWSVILPSKWPIASDLVTFVDTNKQTYKGITKDHWVMTLEFCKTMDSSLDNYNADDAWPTMLDDFYTWKKAQSDEKSPATDAMQE
jgi:DCN1-like protein 4/5